MKMKAIAFAILLGFIFPLVVFGIMEQVIPNPVSGQAESTAPTAQTQPVNNLTALVQTDAETVQEMDLESYITGVVLGEMPADFEPEALKAQAVVARTFTAKRMAKPKHERSQVCTDSTCCQAYLSVTDYIAKGGQQSAVDRVISAVSETKDQILTYNGELIEATYFSCSGGRTEDALAVWGTDIPYLQATDSPGEEIATHYMDTVTFTVAEFQSLLGRSMDGAPASWLGQVSYTDGGGVKEMKIGGQTYTGTELRKLLGLRSTAFVMTILGDTVTVTTKGFGHRVGMSQYGAEAMAVQGSTYDQILLHYYQGTKIADLKSVLTDAK